MKQEHVVKMVEKLLREREVREFLREVASVNLALQGGAQPSVWGIQGSGYGRELSTLGVEEFVNKKLILVSDSNDAFS